MAVTAVPYSTKATITLHTGTNPSTGKTITKNITMSKLRSNPDGQKIYNIVDAVAPCLAGTVALVKTTEVKTLEKV